MLKNRSMPEASVIPVLLYADVAEAAEWLSRAFGFSLRLSIGDHRAQMTVGDGAVVISQGPVAPSGDSVMVRVEDVDMHQQRAAAAGAEVLAAPTTFPYGERQYSVRDFAGRNWIFSQSVADVDPADWGGVFSSSAR